MATGGGPRTVFPDSLLTRRTLMINELECRGPESETWYVHHASWESQAYPLEG
jgi:hypothetical protein